MGKKDGEHADRGAMVLYPQPPSGSFVLLLPSNMTWDVAEFGGVLRVTFRPRTPAETAAKWRARTRQG